MTRWAIGLSIWVWLGMPVAHAAPGAIIANEVVVQPAQDGLTMHVPTDAEHPGKVVGSAIEPAGSESQPSAPQAGVAPEVSPPDPPAVRHYRCGAAGAMLMFLGVGCLLVAVSSYAITPRQAIGPSR